MNTFAEAIVLSGFQTLDFIILTVYIILIVSLGMFVSHDRKKETSAKDYFLASNTLTWWAVGASLIAANISTEQFIGMSGTSFANGIAIAAYELMAALILIVIGKFLLPTMVSRKTKTIQQFLSERYNDRVGLAFAILWLFIYVFINLTSVAWLGALAIEQIFGLQGILIDLGFISISLRTFTVFALFVVAGSYTTYGGLLAVAWTDVLQSPADSSPHGLSFSNWVLYSAHPHLGCSARCTPTLPQATTLSITISISSSSSHTTQKPSATCPE